MPLLPLTSTMTRRKQTDTPCLSLLYSVVYVLLRWGTDHGRHRLGVNRVPFIWLDAAGGPIRQPKRGWGRGRPMLSQSLKLTSLLGTLQTTVKLIKLPEKMSQYVWVACQRREMSITAIWRCLQVMENLWLLCHLSDSASSLLTWVQVNLVYLAIFVVILCTRLFVFQHTLNCVYAICIVTVWLWRLPDRFVSWLGMGIDTRF